MSLFLAVYHLSGFEPVSLLFQELCTLIFSSSHLLVVSILLGKVFHHKGVPLRYLLSFIVHSDVLGWAWERNDFTEVLPQITEAPSISSLILRFLFPQTRFITVKY